jgi:hypothetical protein
MSNNRRVYVLGADGILGILPQLRANQYGCLVVDRAELMLARFGNLRWIR